MDWLRQALAQFRAIPSQDKVPVLLCNRSVLNHLASEEFDAIPDELTMGERVQAISQSIGTLWIDKLLGAISDVVSGVVVTPDGVPGRISFPIFPFRTANNEIVRSVQCIDRDRLSSKTFVKYFGLFKKLPDNRRPRVLFMSDDTRASARFFASMADMFNVYEAFPERLVHLNLLDDGDENDYFEYFASGSFAVASNQSIEFPEPHADESLIRQQVIKNYHICMAQQHESSAFSLSASANIQNLIRHLDRYLLSTRDPQPTDFLLSAKIQCLLLKILIDDDDGESLYQAIALSKAVGKTAYVQKCLRFSNQIAGVSSYALECLAQSASAITELCEREGYQQIHRLEYFAVMQNIFITRIFNRKNMVDVGEPVDCLEFATAQYRYFDELAMLANSVGLSYLVTGNLKEAEAYLGRACTYSADRVTHLNIRINHLISRLLAGDMPARETVSLIFEEYRHLPFGAGSGYHAAMSFGNLWKLTKSKDLRKQISREAILRNFINSDQDGDAIIPMLRRRGFLFMKDSTFTGPFGSLLDHSGFMPAFHFNWSTPVAEPSAR
jgi:hypothetical protein